MSKGFRDKLIELLLTGTINGGSEAHKEDELKTEEHRTNGKLTFFEKFPLWFLLFAVFFSLAFILDDLFQKFVSKLFSFFVGLIVAFFVYTPLKLAVIVSMIFKSKLAPLFVLGLLSTWMFYRNISERTFKLIKNIIVREVGEESESDDRYSNITLAWFAVGSFLASFPFLLAIIADSTDKELEFVMTALIYLPLLVGFVSVCFVVAGFSSLLYKGVFRGVSVDSKFSNRCVVTWEAVQEFLNAVVRPRMLIIWKQIIRKVLGGKIQSKKEEIEDDGATVFSKTGDDELELVILFSGLILLFFVGFLIGISIAGMKFLETVSQTGLSDVFSLVAKGEFKGVLLVLIPGYMSSIVYTVYRLSRNTSQKLKPYFEDIFKKLSDDGKTIDLRNYTEEEVKKKLDEFEYKLFLLLVRGVIC